MKWVLIVLGGLALLVGFLLVAGLLLPRRHQATSEIVLREPRERIWPVIRDLGALQGTWPDLQSARRLDDPAGREVWEERVGGFPMRIVVTAEAPPRELVTTIEAGEDAAFGGRWIYRIAETPEGGSRIQITEDGWIGNPVFRVMAQVGGLHRSIDGYLRALGLHFGQEVSPIHLPARATMAAAH